MCFPRCGDCQLLTSFWSCSIFIRKRLTVLRVAPNHTTTPTKHQATPKNSEKHRNTEQHQTAPKQAAPSNTEEHRGTTPSNTEHLQSEQHRAAPSNSEEHRGTPSNTEQHRGTPSNTEEHRGTPRNTEEHRATPRNTEEHRATPRKSSMSDTEATRTEQQSGMFFFFAGLRLCDSNSAQKGRKTPEIVTKRLFLSRTRFWGLQRVFSVFFSALEPRIFLKEIAV